MLSNGSTIRQCYFALAVLAALSGCEVSTIYETSPDEHAEAPASDEAPLQEPALETESTEKIEPKPEINYTTRGRLKFVQGYTQGYYQAQRDGRPMFVYFTAPWCQFCERMAIETFTDQQVVQLAEQFTCVLVDADQEPQVCQQFQVSGYPTVQFVSPTGMALNRVTGKRAAPQFALEMRAALRAVARRSGPSPIRQF